MLTRPDTEPVVVAVRPFDMSGCYLSDLERAEPDISAELHNKIIASRHTGSTKLFQYVVGKPNFGPLPAFL